MDMVNLTWMWRLNYPAEQPRPLRQLPACARSMRIFIYNLPHSYHASLLTAMESRRGSSSCDYARSDCWERTRSKPIGGNWDYSVLRQYAAEVPILAKFLQMPRLTSDPESADLLVVPWFASTELSGGAYMPWYPKNKVTANRFAGLLDRLTHFKGRLRQRHLFLSSRDWTFSVVALKELVASSQALMVSYGPRRPEAANELLIAPNGAGFGMALQPIQPWRHLLFCMMDEKINPIRKDVGRELRRLATLREGVHYHPIGDHMSIPLTPERAHALMAETLVCPIVQGDLPYQHRLYDVRLSSHAARAHPRAVRSSASLPRRSLWRHAPTSPLCGVRGRRCTPAACHSSFDIRPSPPALHVRRGAGTPATRAPCGPLRASRSTTTPARGTCCLTGRPSTGRPSPCVSTPRRCTRAAWRRRSLRSTWARSSASAGGSPRRVTRLSTTGAVLGATPSRS